MDWLSFLGYLLFALTIYLYILGCSKKEDFKKNSGLFFTISLVAIVALSFGLTFLKDIQNQYLHTDMLSYTIVASVPTLFALFFSKTHAHRKIYAIVGGVILRTGISRIGNYILSFFPSLNDYLSLLISTLTIIVFFVPIYLFLMRKIALDDNFVPSRRDVVLLIVLGLIGMPCAYIEQFVQNDIFFYTYYVVFELLFFFLVSFIQYYLYASYRRALMKEYEKELIHQRLEQYDNLQEVINVMNIKAHDLKHQIREIKAKNQLDEEVVDDLNKIIDEYNSTIKTGYELLDSVLTQKKYVCLSKETTLNIIVDEKYFRIFTTEELKSFIGNALDNAIEYVSKIENKENRYIGLKTVANDFFFKIIVENYCETPVAFDKNGFPISTKGDIWNHGFGTKSIARICKKHGGEVNFYYENNTFSIIALFPISTLNK